MIVKQKQLSMVEPDLDKKNKFKKSHIQNSPFTAFGQSIKSVDFISLVSMQVLSSSSLKTCSPDINDSVNIN